MVFSKFCHVVTHKIDHYLDLCFFGHITSPTTLHQNRMIREAYTFLALNEIKLKAIETNEIAFSYFGLDARVICDVVKGNAQNTTSILYAALGYCNDIDMIERQIYDHMVEQVRKQVTLTWSC